MKKTVLLMLILGTSISYADQQTDDLNAKRMAWSKAYLEKQGLPTPDGGVK